MNKNTRNIVSVIAAAALAIIGIVSANSNDVVLVPGGSYGNLTYNQVGTSDDPVVIWGNGSTARCVNVNGQYITLRDLTVTDCPDHGIIVRGQNIVIEDNTVTHIESDRFTSDGQYCTTSGGFGSAIKLALGAENVIVRDNYVHHNCGEGIAATRAPHVVIENNHVVDNHNVGIYVDNSFDVVVRNNLVECRDWAVAPGTNGNGISLGQENYGSTWGKQLHDVTIQGNTINGCRIGIAGFSHIGTLNSVTIDSNLIPSGTANSSRAISLQMSSANNVTVSNNGVWWTQFTLPAGVVQFGNYLYTGSGATNTPAPATATRTATRIPPTLTPTASRTITPVVTLTHTPISPTITITPTIGVVPTVCEFSPSFMICTRP